ncbi:MAG: hypothetical protein JXJ04_25565 [Spirochaetales bacterium]|nr:hypothetical protein [Spirochaetales bacterium]
MKNEGPAEIVLEDFEFDDITENELLVETLYGSWEANMSHAIERKPVDVCMMRREDKIVLGNAGVVRVLECGANVKNIKPGGLYMLAPIGTEDESGYLQDIFGYNTKGSIGLLAKKTKVLERQLLPVPVNSKYSLSQWAAFSLKYQTAWHNWKVAYGSYRLQMTSMDCQKPLVWAWGGGVSFAEVTLARHFDCKSYMIASEDERISQLRENDIIPIDRRSFIDLHYDIEKIKTREYSMRYRKAENAFLKIVEEYTDGKGVSIFVDNIGLPVFPATLKALSRQGVITTCGWKKGYDLSFNRAIECYKQHLHINTTGNRLINGLEAIQFAEDNGWIPSKLSNVYTWDQIPTIISDYSENRIKSYFPVFKVN